jgi:hypothetical protein
LTPLTVPNSPPANTEAPSGPGASARTLPLSWGAKVASIMPVRMSNAKL